jgi:hypothetical protein
MSIAEDAVTEMERLAKDDSHGYDQTNRWGPDYDCSSAVITVWESVGVPVKTNGASYTGNMRGVFLRCGFEDVTDSVDLTTGNGMVRGDVLLNYQHHTAMYCGGLTEVEASINELGTVTGGETGDQTGREILIRSYRNYPWDCVLRYGGEATKKVTVKPSYEYSVLLGLLKLGMEDKQVETVQAVLSYMGYYEGQCDGIFGELTEAAVKEFQEKMGLLCDGEVGGQTWSALLKGGAAA